MAWWRAVRCMPELKGPDYVFRLRVRCAYGRRLGASEAASPLHEKKNSPWRRRHPGAVPLSTSEDSEPPAVARSFGRPLSSRHPRGNGEQGRVGWMVWYGRSCLDAPAMPGRLPGEHGPSLEHLEWERSPEFSRTSSMVRYLLATLSGIDKTDHQANFWLVGSPDASRAHRRE